MPSALVQVQPKIDEDPREDRSRQDNYVNEQLLTAISDVYSPVLKLMKLFGLYFGDTSFTYLSPNCATARSRKHSYLWCIYCGVLVAGHSLNLIMAFSDVFLGNHIFVYLMFSVWCLLTLLSGVISFFVLCVPLTYTRKSRFENFVRSLCALDNNVKLENVKNKTRKGVVVFWIFFIACTGDILVTNLYLDYRMAVYKPWNQWSGFNILSITFLVIASALWVLPILFYRTTCLILEELFDDLQKRMSSRLSTVFMDFEALKMEHHRLCEVVAFADKMLAPLLFELVSLYIPLIILNLYKVVNLPEKDKYEFLANNIFWFLISTFFVGLIMWLGSSVCEKIHSFKGTLQSLPISKEDEGKLLLFILDLQDDPKGLSIGGLVVITKSMSLTIVGVIVSYFTVLLSLPK